MKNWDIPGGLWMAGILMLIQYILAFFVYKLPGLGVIDWIGWAFLALSVFFGVAPIFILRQRGCVLKGKSYIQTTRLVDSSLYGVVRHPQYLSFILFNLSMILLAPHWLVILLGSVSTFIIYLEIQAADRQGIQKFGNEYRQYMQRVPQINLPLGLLRLMQTKHAKEKA